MSVKWVEALPYYQLRQTNLCNYNEVPDTDNMRTELLTFVDEVNSTSVQDLQRHARRKDYAAMIDLGMRLYTGCTVAKDESRAEQLWQSVADSSRPRAVPKQLGAACSLLAHLHFEKFRQSALQSVLDKAAIAARATVHHGMRTPTVLQIAKAMEGYNLRTQAPFDDPRFMQFWAVLDERVKEMEEEDRKRERKVRKEPNAYVCANCGIGATSRTGLRKCSGPCKVEDKPSYCSTDCQRADWPSHKPDCKPGKKRLGSKPSTSISPLSNRDVPSDAPRISDPALPEKSRGYRTVVPGPKGPVEFITKTMSPEMLRDVADETKRLGSRMEELRLGE